MKRELILHIGLPKTGTTSIQYFLSNRRDILLDKGVLFPVSPGRTNHSLFAAMMLGPALVLRHFSPTVWEGMTPAVRIERFEREFNDELANLREHVRTVVISSEHCGVFLDSKAAIEGVARLLGPIFERIRIVVYLRRQDQLEASLHSERLRVGEVVEPTLPRGDYSGVWLYNYESLLDAWASAFGEEAIVVRIFERQSLLNGDAIEDFLSTCEIDVEVPPNDPDRSRNASLGLAAQQLMTVTAKRLVETRGAGVLETALWRRIGNAYSNASHGRGWLPTRAEAVGFMAQFARSNDAVRSRFLPDRETLFTEDYETLPQSPIELDSVSLLAEAVDVLALTLENAANLRSFDLLRLARLHRRVEDYATAKKNYVEAIWNNPKLVAARVELAEEMLREGDVAGAREHARLAREIEPNSKSMRNLLERLARAELATR